MVRPGWPQRLAKLNKLTIKVDRPQLSPTDIKKLQAAMQEKAKAD
jgi:arylsulfatase